MPYLPLAPGPGNTAGGPLARGLSLALPRSKDRNLGSATPSDARGRRRIIVPCPPGLDNTARRVCLWDRWDRSLPSLRGMPITDIVGSAPRGTSWRTFPCCSLEAGTYLPCWVCSCQGEGPTIICCRSEPNRGGWSGYIPVPAPGCKRVYEVTPQSLQDQGILAYCG